MNNIKTNILATFNSEETIPAIDLTAYVHPLAAGARCRSRSSRRVLRDLRRRARFPRPPVPSAWSSFNWLGYVYRQASAGFPRHCKQ